MDQHATPQRPSDVPGPRRVWRRRIIVGIACLAALAIVLTLLHPLGYYTVVGYLKREAFYKGRPTSYWIQALRKEEDVYSESGPFGVQGKTLRDGGADVAPVLIEILQANETNARMQALVTLNFMRLKSPDLVPPLLDLLNTENDLSNLRLAMQVLHNMDPEASWTAPASILNKNPHPRARAWSVTALMALASEHPDAIQTLRAALRDQESQVRMGAAIALEKIGAPTAWVFPELRECLTDSDVRVRLSAAQAVWHLSGQAEPVVPIFIGVLSLTGPEIECADAGQPVAVAIRPLQLRAMQILAEMGPGAGKAVAILIHFLKQDDVGLRRAAASVLGSIGPAAADAVTLLREFLNTRDGGLHLSAAIALARIAPDTGDSIKTLLDDLRDPDSPTRVEAVMALGQIGSAARDAVPELASHLEEVTILGVEAARALWRIGHKDAPVLEALVRAVQEGDNYCRMESLTILGELGPQARKVLPTLVALYIENSDALYWSRMAVLVAAPGTPLLGRPLAVTLLQTGRRRPGAVIQPRLAVVIKRIDSVTAGKLGIP